MTPPLPTTMQALTCLRSPAPPPRPPLSQATPDAPDACLARCPSALPRQRRAAARLAWQQGWRAASPHPALQPPNAAGLLQDLKPNTQRDKPHRFPLCARAPSRGLPSLLSSTLFSKTAAPSVLCFYAMSCHACPQSIFRFNKGVQFSRLVLHRAPCRAAWRRTLCVWACAGGVHTVLIPSGVQPPNGPQNNCTATIEPQATCQRATCGASSPAANPILPSLGGPPLALRAPNLSKAFSLVPCPITGAASMPLRS